MQYRVEPHSHVGYVRTVFRGHITLGMILEAARHATTTAQQNKITHHILDMLQSKPSISTLDAFTFASRLEEHGFSRFGRHAFVDNKKDSMLQFIETVALNRGYQVRLFPSLPDAELWLEEYSSRQKNPRGAP